MRLLSVRLIVSLIIGVTLVSLGFSYYQVVQEKRGLRGDLEKRAEILAEGLTGNIERSWDRTSDKELKVLVERSPKREHLVGIAIYDRTGKLLAVTPELGAILSSVPDALTSAVAQDRDENVFARLSDKRVHSCRARP